MVFKPRAWDLPLSYLRSTDRGRSWSAPLPITPTGYYACCQDLTASRGAVHLVYRQQGDPDSPYYYRRSPDGGFTWEPPRRITPKVTPGMAAIAAAGDGVHVLYEYGGRLYHRGSVDRGLTWSSSRRLSANGEYGTVFGDLAVVAGKVHVVWEDIWSGLRYRVSDDAGATWRRPRALTGSYHGSPRMMALGVGRGAVHVVYQTVEPLNEDVSNYYEYYQRRS